MISRTLLRRAMSLPVLLVLVTIAAFSLTLLLPGNAADAVAGENASAEQVAAARQTLRLDDPVPTRYAAWLGDVVRGDFGDSVVTHRPIGAEIARRLPITLSIGIFALLFAVVGGTLIGVVQALFANRWIDRVLLAIVSAFLSIPNFWLATMLVGIFAVQLRWLPAIGYTAFGDSPTEWFRHIILPVITLSLFPMAEVARQIRTGLIGVLDKDYIRAARARGIAPNRVISKHAMKNAAGPALTIVGLRVGYLFAGSVIVERIFNLPGLGAYALQAIQTRDVPAIQSIVLISALIVIVTGLVVDLTYSYLNPKVRIS